MEPGVVSRSSSALAMAPFMPAEPGVSTTVAPYAFLEDRHHARITAVSPVVEKNGVVHLEATLTPHPHLKPGMSVIIAYGNIE